MRAFYQLAIHFYSFFIRLAATAGNNKATLWINGRKGWRNNLKNANLQKEDITWFHVASLGEFEQARPLMEKIKENEPNTYILLSFFSPSGYEIRKNYNLADKVIYLPVDTAKNAENFLELINPKRVIFVKYEFWFNYLKQISKRRIECYLVCGIFRKNQHFFKWYGGWFRKNLSAFTHFFVQNNESKKLLHKIRFTNVSIAGDTRLDRVLIIANQEFKDNRLESFSRNRKVIAFGSSWEKEHDLALALSQTKLNYKLVIAPHEINPHKIKSLKERFTVKCRLLSETSISDDLSDSTVLIIDKIGLLAKLYRFAHIAFVGGGFGSGIHNILEANVYGIPVLFGPNYLKFQEAFDLIELQAGFSVATESEFIRKAEELLHSKESYEKASNQASTYVEQNKGATEKIISTIYST